MKKNILIAILSIACICSLSWNYTQAAMAKVMPDPLVIVTDPENVGAVLVNQSRYDRFTGTFEVIPPDPISINAQTHTIVLTYAEE
jgi:hypothetical protein